MHVLKPYAEPVVGGIEEGDGWSSIDSIRSRSSRVDSGGIQAVVMLFCCVMWCCCSASG